MTRRDHIGRFTHGSVPYPREHGAPLLCARVKSAPHVKGNLTRWARHRALVWAVAAKLEAGL